MEPICQVRDVDKAVRSNAELSQYFQKMSSGEFEGVQMYPDDVLERVALYLSLSANNSADNVISYYDILGGNEAIADIYEDMCYILAQDHHLTSRVLSIARDLRIPENNLVLGS